MGKSIIYLHKLYIEIAWSKYKSASSGFYDMIERGTFVVLNR